MKNIDHIIIGSGFSGIGMGINLKKQGYNNFVILEKANGLGGTWRENVYPGARCDIPHSLYSFSFDIGIGTYTSQPELLHYLQNVAEKYDLVPHIQYNKNVCRTEYHDGYWTVRTTTGKKYRSKFLIMCVGQLHHPKMPNIPGIETFEGSCFHTAQWDPSVTLDDKRVGVIGSGASGLQVTVEAAKLSPEVHVFQRSANYIMPKLLGTPLQHRAAKSSEYANRLYRSFLKHLLDVVMFRAVQGHWLLTTICLWIWQLNLRLSVKDPAKRKLLTPNYPFGAKRTLVSSDYYPALEMENVALNTSGIERVTPTGVIDKNGKETKLDVLVCATGFKTSPIFRGIEIIGENGIDLNRHWSKRGCQAYMGIVTNGFPNLFFLYGPCSGISHTSILEMIEAQTGFLMKIFSILRKQSSEYTDTENKETTSNFRNDVIVNVKRKVEEDFIDELDKRILTETRFAKVQESMWIENGRVTKNWYGNVAMYKKAVEKVQLADAFDFRACKSSP